MLDLQRPGLRLCPENALRYLGTVTEVILSERRGITPWADREVAVKADWEGVLPGWVSERSRLAR